MPQLKKFYSLSSISFSHVESVGCTIDSGTLCTYTYRVRNLTQQLDYLSRNDSSNEQVINFSQLIVTDSRYSFNKGLFTDYVNEREGGGEDPR